MVRRGFVFWSAVVFASIGFLLAIPGIMLVTLAGSILVQADKEATR